MSARRRGGSPVNWGSRANHLNRSAAARLKGRRGRASNHYDSSDDDDDDDEDDNTAASVFGDVSNNLDLDVLVQRTRTDSEEFKALEDAILLEADGSPSVSDGGESDEDEGVGSASFAEDEDQPVRRVGRRAAGGGDDCSGGGAGGAQSRGSAAPAAAAVAAASGDGGDGGGGGGSKVIPHGGGGVVVGGGGGGGGANADDDLMMEDLDDADLDFEDAPVASTGKTTPSEPVDEATCIALREIVFGRATGRGFPDVWLEQGFVFNDSVDRPGQEFGLVQHKGGPCGPIAAVQAHVLQHLLPNTRPASSRLTTNVRNWATVKPQVLGDVLVEALATILARAAGFYTNVGKYSAKPVAVVALSGAKNRSIASSSRYECDGFTESVQLYKFSDEADLRRFLGEGRAYAQFTDPFGFGVALLTYSAILSRGIKRVKADACQLGMSQPFIGEHCYAAQELVNLLVAGGAYSNVFDGVRELDDKDPTTGQNTKLYGIPRRGGVGCLTLYEHYGYVQCGGHYKNPEHPIWVICSESHYSCFFSTHNTCLTAPEESFDLFFYDALARHEELPEMAVDPTARLEFDVEDGAPLEKVLRTKWKGAKIDWEGEAVL